MIKIFLTVIICSLNLFAHIDKGTWKGVVSDQANCFMDVGDTSFVNGIINPLNERIEIKIGNTLYSVRHPYKIDARTGSVSFDHDTFEDVVPTKTGAFALQIKMIRTAQFEGPGSLVVMEHDWKSGFKEVVSCSELKKVY